MEVCESVCVCVHEEAGSSIMAIYGPGRLWLMTDSHIPDSLDVGYVEHFSFFIRMGLLRNILNNQRQNVAAIAS